MGQLRRRKGRTVKKTMVRKLVPAQLSASSTKHLILLHTTHALQRKQLKGKAV
jgi:hypothetical protein